jgi:hypothetical protein
MTQLIEEGIEPTFAGKPVSQVNADTAAAMGIRKRKTRSDAGKPKPKPAPGGGLSAEQAKRISDLHAVWLKAEATKRECEGSLSAITDVCATYEMEFHALLNELQGK